MLGTKIYNLRKKFSLTQESLAEKLDVARQTISNWELEETSPNPEQLKMLSKIFNVSLDELLENEEFTTDKRTEKNDSKAPIEEKFINSGFEYKSKVLIKGLPLIHVNIGGTIPRRAKGIIAIGDIATGIVALGGITAGIVSVGGLSTGIVAIGGLAVGLITAFGGAAIGTIAIGGGALGVIARGGGALTAY